MKAETKTKGNKSDKEEDGNILRRKKRFDNLLIGKGKLDISFLKKSCNRGAYREIFENWI